MTWTTSETVSLQITFDAKSPAMLAEFWSVALGYRLDDPPPGFDSWPQALEAAGQPPERWDDASAIIPVHGSGPRVFFQKVPESKTVKNRVHLDVNVGHGVENAEKRWEAVQGHVQRLLGLGATLIGRRESEWGDRWMVLQDPEGNEFCVQ